MGNLERLWAVGLLLGSLGLLAVPTGCQPQQMERVVLVTIDTLRADHVGAYGGRHATPTLDGLARDGLRFETTISPAPITLPAHTSILTGLTPPRHGVRNNGTFRLSDDVATLTETFQNAGFATAAFLGAMVLDRQYGLARGFDVYDDRMAPRLAGGHSGVPERRAREVVDEALAWLAKTPPPFFLWVHLYDPHAGYHAPSAFGRRTPDSPYFAEIAYTDDQLGRLLEAIDAQNTLVVVTSDHGEGLGDHGEKTHTLGIYDTTQRVPLLLRGPGVPRGAVHAEPVRLVDVAPTILALADLPPLPDVDGRDLLDPAPAATPIAYVETLSTQLDMGWSPLLGVRSRDWKYIRAPRPELYALESDPDERRNVYAERRDVAARLDRELDTILGRGRPALPNLTPDSESQALLESLGYVVAAPKSQARFGLGRVGGIDPKDGIATLGPLTEAWSRAFRDGQVSGLAELAAVEGGGFFKAQIAAEAALDIGDALAAERFARDAIASAPEFWEGYVSLGRALEEQGRLDESETAFGQAAAQDAAAADPLVGLGRIAETRGAPDRAARLYESAMARRGNSGEAHWRLAALRIEQGDGAGGAALLASLPAELLRTPAAAIRLAAAEASQSNLVTARQRLAAALERHPAHARLREAFDSLGTAP